MPERAPLAVLGFCAAAVAAVAVTALADDRPLAFSRGVPPTGVVAELPRGNEACQRPIEVPADADTIRFTPAVPPRTTAALRVRVRTAARPPASATVLVRGGRQAAVRAPIGVREGERVAVCVASHARGTVGLYGGPFQVAESALYVEGRPVAADLSLEFVRAEPRSALALVPAMLKRAALFNASWVAPGVLWALLVVFAAAVPVLLTVALRKALREPDPAEGRRP